MAYKNNDIEAKLFGADVTAGEDISLEELQGAVKDIRVRTNVDILMIMDGTGSMKPHINRTRELAKSIWGNFQKALGEKSREVEQMRIAVVTARDLYVDKDWIQYSPFFVISDGEEQRKAFESYVEGIEAYGGGDEPENHLEALSLALQHYDFTKEGEKRRIIVFYFTDSSAHHLDDKRRYSCAAYPQNVPEDLDGLAEQLIEKIGAEEMRSFRFFPVAPNMYPWNEIGDYFPQTHLLVSRAGEGLDEIDLDIVGECVANSI